MNTGQVTEQVEKAALVTSQRLLIIGGMVLILCGMIFGDIYAVFILHPNVARIGAEFASAAQAVAAQDADSVFGHFRTIGSLLENAGTKKDTHVHIIQFGYLALILAFVQPYMALSGRRRLRFARLFMVGAVVLPVSVFLIHYVGLAYSPLRTIGWASIFADFGGLLVIIACTGYLLGIWRYVRDGTGPSSVPYPVVVDRESRILLCGGVLLLLAGFVFGAYYAAVFLDAHAAHEMTTLRAVMDGAAAGNMEGATESLAAYGVLQGEKAVMIAAHAHVGEFGLLAVMLALVQPYVFLSRRWRRRWVAVLLGGAVMLPIAVFAEQWFGLLAGGVADIGGLLVIVALCGMLAGVLRHTGKVDSRIAVET